MKLEKLVALSSLSNPRRHRASDCAYPVQHSTSALIKQSNTLFSLSEARASLSSLQLSSPPERRERREKREKREKRKKRKKEERENERENEREREAEREKSHATALPMTERPLVGQTTHQVYNNKHICLDVYTSPLPPLTTPPQTPHLLVSPGSARCRLATASALTQSKDAAAVLLLPHTCRST